MVVPCPPARGKQNRGPLFQILEEVGAFPWTWKKSLEGFPSFVVFPCSPSENKYLSLRLSRRCLLQTELQGGSRLPDEGTLVLVSPVLVHERYVDCFALACPAFSTVDCFGVTIVVSLVCSCALCSCALCSTCRLALSSS